MTEERATQSTASEWPRSTCVGSRSTACMPPPPALGSDVCQSIAVASSEPDMSQRPHSETATDVTHSEWHSSRCRTPPEPCARETQREPSQWAPLTRSASRPRASADVRAMARGSGRSGANAGTRFCSPPARTSYVAETTRDGIGRCGALSAVEEAVRARSRSRRCDETSRLASKTRRTSSSGSSASGTPSRASCDTGDEAPPTGLALGVRGGGAERRAGCGASSSCCGIWPKLLI
mmetsp:Transcript_63539/g.189348  ORF Transcript_63539/g.189348 Transcript_63539/m.189348 type:complete len:236 (-) Transcript_63539:178-885(-)